MIIYDEGVNPGFTDFGIEIPIHHSKAQQAMAALLANPAIRQHIKGWYIPAVTESLTRDDLLRVHSAEYVEKLFSPGLQEEIIKTFELIDAEGHYHRYNPQNASLPLTDLFELILKKAAGSYQCAREALEKGFCFYFGGGMHHAHRDYGSGFCLVNDIVIALARLQAEKRIATAWVIDVDAHKGDGTADLTLGNAAIITLSVHMAKGWPLDGEPYRADNSLNPAFITSDIDIPIAAGEDSLYIPRLKDGLSHLELLPPCDLAVVVSGADPYAGDALPSTAGLQLSLNQLLERDKLIYTFLERRHIPSAYLMAGGYGPSSWQVYSGFLKWVCRERCCGGG